MDTPMKQIIEVLNKVPKANLNYAMAIYDRYSKEYDDGVFENSEWNKVFILPFIIQQSLGPIGQSIGEQYFDKLEEFFSNNYQQDFLLKTDLFLQVMAEKTRKYFSVTWGDEKMKAGKYTELFGIKWEFEIKNDGMSKTEFVMDMVNLFLSEYLKKILFIRVFIIYNIIVILENNDYSTELTDEYIFNLINNDLEKTFLNEVEWE